jgi:hypothetical protein
MKFLSYLILIILSMPDSQAQSDYLVFGKGGGISGEVTQYRILKNGKVYRGTGRVDILFTQKGKIGKPDVKKICSDLKKFPDSSFHHPGNMYYFIRFPGDASDIDFTWGDPAFAIPEALGELYRDTFVKISKLKYKALKKPIR